MNDYNRIAHIIRYLDEHHTEQPGLATLAEHAGLSSFYFHRLFSAWAGITPKDFLQCLTLAHAKELLKEGESVMGAALESGLSGPGRLHDLCVSLECASPGELKTGGSGWTIIFGIADTPFGKCMIGKSPRGICHLSFIHFDDEDTALEELRKNWPNARLSQNDTAAMGLARRIFGISAGPRTRPALRVFVRATAFQVRVWRALLQVPPGALVTYGRLAVSIGKPDAARAVGNAVGANQLAYLIPCHRVIRKTGVTGEYRWGRTRKRIILAWESAARLTSAKQN
ncbi:MAG: methylated-DNA--[protein]-cysteine S-methyltransferase [Nitrospiraceae bacterium]|nr:methylated-DNA--[protein]-cysteine S-methyltransferase [Nitrospiraceae bacterium]